MEFAINGGLCACCIGWTILMIVNLIMATQIICFCDCDCDSNGDPNRNFASSAGGILHLISPVKKYASV